MNPGKEPSLTKGKLVGQACSLELKRNIKIGKPIFVEIHKINLVLSNKFKILPGQDCRNLEHRFSTTYS